MSNRIRVIWSTLGGSPPHATQQHLARRTGFEVLAASSTDTDAAVRLVDGARPDAVVVEASDEALHEPVARILERVAVPVVAACERPDLALARRLIRTGAADVVDLAEATTASLARALVVAVARVEPKVDEARAPDTGPIVVVHGESEAVLRALVHNGSDLITIVSRRGHVRYHSPSLERILGYRPGERIGRPFDEFIHSEDRTAVAASLRRIRNRPSAVTAVEVRIRHRDGSWRFLAAKATNMLEDPNIRGFVINAWDVTDRRLAEQRLHLLQTAVHEASEGMAITTAGPSLGEQSIVFVNPAFSEMSGYSIGEAEGRKLGMLFGRETAPESLRAIDGDLAAGRPAHEEVTVTRKDGSKYLLDWHVTPLRRQGKVTHFVSVMRDVTARRQLELQLRQAQKMEAVGRLAGGIAHDFNNLLTAIAGYAELIHGEVDAASPSSEYVGEIQKAAERAGELTAKLLAFSRKQVLRPQVLDLGRVIVGVDGMLRRVLGENVHLATRLGDALPAVRADPGQVEQVIVNLAVNARDAMPEGGQLVISTGETIVSRSGGAVPRGHWVTLTVSDTGHGMDSETRTRIFEPFFTTKEAGKGTGLGLSTVYGIVTQSGGHITVDSEPGAFTRVTVYLPASSVAAPAPQPRLGDGSTSAPLRGATILLAEDDPAVRHFLHQILTANGHQVLCAENGSHAIRLLAKHGAPIDLVISDMVMPDMSGPELIERLGPLMPEVPLLLISGYADSLRQPSAQIERAAFLSKPFTAGALTAKVDELLSTGIPVDGASPGAPSSMPPESTPGGHGPDDGPRLVGLAAASPLGVVFR